MAGQPALSSMWRLALSEGEASGQPSARPWIAAHVGSRVVYDTRGSSRRVSVAPLTLISRDRTGVAVSLGF